MRLIDADELKKDLICFYPEGVPSGLDSETMFKQILHDIDNAPTVEQRPHGKWIEVPVKRDILHPNGIKYVCSACKRDNCYGKPPFCMWCGATMKLEEEEQHESQ